MARHELTTPALTADSDGREGWPVCLGLNWRARRPTLIVSQIAADDKTAVVQDSSRCQIQ